jgi:glycosyltransferase involved in cell wall biosynthesis
MSGIRANSSSQSIQTPLFGPVAEDVQRPLWSVMIPTYNRTEYLEQTLKCVLAQDLGPDKMHIEVIDNCSTESNPEALIQKIGQDRVSYYRQPENIGLVGNLNTCIQHARGHLVHILHDDDLVAPGFYEQMQEAFEKEPSIGAAFCRTFGVSETGQSIKLFKPQRKTAGILENWIERIAVKNLMQPPSVVVRRSVYEELGGFHPKLMYSCDWEMWTRISAHYPVWYDPKILASTRLHSSSDSSVAIRSGENVTNEREAIAIMYSYLPHSKAEKLYKIVSENCSLWAIMCASRVLAKGDATAALAQIRVALREERPSVKVMGLLVLLPVRSLGFCLKDLLNSPRRLT